MLDKPHSVLEGGKSVRELMQVIVPPRMQPNNSERFLYMVMYAAGAKWSSFPGVMYLICPRKCKKNCPRPKKTLACGDVVPAEHHGEFLQSLESKFVLKKSGWKETMLKRHFHPDNILGQYKIKSPKSLQRDIVWSRSKKV
jgi:hypothetical protein